MLDDIQSTDLSQEIVILVEDNNNRREAIAKRTETLKHKHRVQKQHREINQKQRDN